MSFTARHFGIDWELEVVEDNGINVNVLFSNSLDEELGIMFWSDGSGAKTFAFCTSDDDAGILTIDYDDLMEFIIFAKQIKTAEKAIEYGKHWGVYKKGELDE